MIGDATDRAYFWANVSTECWVWKGPVNSNGYGFFGVGGKNIKAHRFMWENFNGSIPDGLCVLHRCDVPRCVNPAHLFLGTHTDNMRDASAKKRFRQQIDSSHFRGERNGAAKLTPTQVLEIRTAEGRCEDIGRRFGVSRSLVHQIKKRKIWTHLP